LWSTTFTLDKLDDKLSTMTLIHTLPEDYNLFVSSLLLKDNLNKAAVQIVFVCKNNQYRCQYISWLRIMKTQLTIFFAHKVLELPLGNCAVWFL